MVEKVVEAIKEKTIIENKENAEIKKEHVGTTKKHTEIKKENVEVKKESTETTKHESPKRNFEPRRDFQKRDFRGRRDFGRDKDYSQHKETESKPVFVKKKSQFAAYKLFNKWSFDEVIVSDPSLVRYINLEPIITPHTFGRKSQGRFAKQNINVVERLVNKIMRSGQGKRKLSGKYIRGRKSCGKKLQALQIVEGAFTIIQEKTKKNPIQVLVEAIQNAAPHEDVTRVKRGGVSYSLAVDVAPLKGLDESLKNIALAGFGNSFNKNVSAQEALAEEIIAASTRDGKSIALKRKEEVERVAKASR